MSRNRFLEIENIFDAIDAVFAADATTLTPEAIERKIALMPPTTSPTPEQLQAGKWPKTEFTFHGIRVCIENPKGSIRRGVSPSGKKWSSTLTAHYGEVKGTDGYDGDPVDIFIGDTPRSESVFVIDQVDPTTGQFDEHKCVMGVQTPQQAKALYLSNYEPGWLGFGGMKEMSIGDFRSWLKDPLAQKLPVSYTIPATDASLPEPIPVQEGETPLEAVERQSIESGEAQNEPPQGLTPEQVDEWYKTHGKSAGDASTTVTEGAGRSGGDSQYDLKIDGAFDGDDWGSSDFRKKNAAICRSLWLTRPAELHGYGSVYWNPSEAVAYGVSSDTHTEEDCSLWQKRMESVSGVDKATVEAETSPHRNGFYRIEVNGQVVNLNALKWSGDSLADSVEEFETTEYLAGDSDDAIEILAVDEVAETMTVRQKAARVDMKNLNNRIYPRPVMEKAISDALPTARAGAMLSEFLHPKVAVVDGAEHYVDKPDEKTAQVLDIEMPGADGWVYVTRRILPTPRGREVQARIKRRDPLGISTRFKMRGHKRDDGVIVADTLKIHTWDDVYTPAVEGAGALA